MTVPLSDDEASFLAPPDGNLIDDGYLLFDYDVETLDDPLRAALHLCREQSTALWRRPGVDEDYRPKHAARLVDVAEFETRDVSVMDAHLPHHLPTEGPYRRAHIRVAHPTVNFGPRLPNMLTAACGEGAYFSPGVTAVRLRDIHFPAEFLAAFEGPRFGLEGVRALLGVAERPLVCGVVKPNLGLPIDAFADLACEGLRGGADMVKDDEMLADAPYSPLRERVEKVFPRVEQAHRETGEGKLFIANITDEVERLLALLDAVTGRGGPRAAVMLNAWCVGLSACRMVARHARVPLVSHFDFVAAFARVPFHGVSDLVATKLQRLAGFDLIIMPGLGGRMGTTVAGVVANLRACLEPMGAIRAALPLPGGSDWAGSLLPMVDAFQTRDFGIICGRGIFGHPDGPAAGARSVRDAWDAIAVGKDPRDVGAEAPALARAFQAFAR